MLVELIHVTELEWRRDGVVIWQGVSVTTRKFELKERTLQERVTTTTPE
jgi:hypothetical protein